MTKIQFPAGLINHDIEFFDFNNQTLAIHNGMVKNFEELPSSIHDIIWNYFSTKPEIIQALENNGYKSKKSKIKKITSCRFGGFDAVSDIRNLSVNQSEYFDCGNRGNCSMEGIVCSFPKFNDHVLSPFELKIIKLLSTELTLPAIADEMKVCANTLDNKKKVLFEKFNVLSRPRLVALAFQNNLIL